ncbi:MAG TPA: FG-GAP repeat protein [Kofleriaceae bacterium]|nr:FG-GAP repeat protein [Kofleriaceae bacterium]
MWRCAAGFMIVYWLTACDQVLGISEVTQGYRVGGRVHGLWDGADGVALHLMANGVDTLLTVSANGEFHFEPEFTSGVSYSVTVAANPVQHTCVVDHGGNGIVSDVDATSVSIACTGPAVTIAFSGLWGWEFDPTEEMQMFAGSVIAQDVALRISGGGMISASVNDTAAKLDEPTAAIALPLGSTTVRVGLLATGGLSKTYELIFNRATSAIDQISYGKASNTGELDAFGVSVSLFGDTLAVGAPGEASAATGVNGNQANNSATRAGAVYVFVHTGTIWTQQAYLKASNTGAGDGFGSSVSLFGDTLVVGAPFEASAATGVNGNQADNTAGAAGAVYVFARTGTTWAQQAYLKASNTGGLDEFGSSVSLSGDTLAIGAPGEASAATGVNGDQADNRASAAGAVYVFVRTRTTWTQQAYLKASNTAVADDFGSSVSLSGDTLAVGAPSEASAATGVNGNQSDNSAYNAGAVYVFMRTGTTWTQQAYLKASNTGMGDEFGSSVSLSGDTLTIGAPFEASAAAGINGNQTDNSAYAAGAVYVFVRRDTTWVQQAYLKASNAEANGQFGSSVSLSGDTLAVGAPLEASAATGINGNQTDESASNAGAIYVFVRMDTTWTQPAYLKASNTEAGDVFGGSVSLSGDTLASGAPGEDSAANGVNGNQADNTAYAAGAVYVFR